MSNKYINEVKYMQMKNVPKQVLNALADFASDNGVAYPSIDTLAAVTCLTGRSVINGISQLCEQGIITKRVGTGGNNIYTLHLENFKGECKKPSRIYLNNVDEVVNDVHHCTTFTSEPHSPTSEPRSCGSESHSLGVVNDVHPNHHINHQLTTKEPSDIHTQENQKTDDEIEIKKPTPKKPRSTKKQKTTIPENFGISEQVQAWAETNKFNQLEVHLENFVNLSIAKGYEYVDWDRAFMNAIRGNWAKIQTTAPQQQKYQSTTQTTISEQQKWDNYFKKGSDQFMDVTPKKNFLMIEGIGNA
ncbi:helix-turn-helix domain-containing protein [Acinetobacter rathckeae]|uniref:helix-turn-helix domain-containing protein n=1 Tax=Acinetobacter rathckeae TaxID=2605272 RepID=UPI0018A31872|nr:helix-turn-helix domain-containing protein [Acinetobacter rathckeae]MBF7696643.1 helix-turn-helix domain-containing protein [Acinetobacter rathckeae]